MKKILNNCIVQVVIGFGLFGLLWKFTWDLIFWVNTKLYYSSKLIFIAPGTLSYGAGTCLLYLSILIILWGWVRIKQGIEISRKDKIVFNISKITCIFTLSMMFINNSAIYEDKIYYRSVWNLKGRTYLYTDIKSVRISTATTKGCTEIYYDLNMKDGIEINLMSKEANYNYIPEVEKHISKAVPHTIYSSEYKYLKDSNRIPYKIYSYFKIK